MNVRDWPYFKVRVPPEAYERIKRDAKAGYRSLNSEVVMILEKHFAAQAEAQKQEAAEKTQ